MKKRELTQEQLSALYVDQGLSQRKIGEMCGVLTRTVGKWLKKDGVAARPRGCPFGCNTGARRAFISKSQLENMYLSQGMSQREIAEAYGLSEWAIGKRMQAFGIKSRPKNWVRSTPRKAKLCEEDLRRLYITERRSQSEIGKMFGLHPITVSKWLRRFGVPSDSPWERRKANIDLAEAQRLHQEDGWSLKAIAKRFECSEWTIKNRFKKNGIAIAGDLQRRNQRIFKEATAEPLTSLDRGYRKSRGSLVSGSLASMEHRSVCEDALGRLMGPKEVVHHLNGNKRDNAISNLAVLPSNVVHAQVHRHLERVGMYLCGLTDIRPAALDFGSPVFWGGEWVTSIDLIQRARATPLSAPLGVDSPRNHAAETIN